ncbi:MAG: hypothetical protein E7658_05045 [Ruminococcaceae bacterium]|nr:hypothetical protein [Oscillospiraceae bacterium]
MKPSNNVDVKAVFRKLGFLFLNFVLLYGGFRIIIALGEKLQLPIIYYIGTGLYMAALAGLIIAFYILNGYSFDSRKVTAEDLPADWTTGQKTEYLEKLAAGREKGKKLLYVLLPMVVTVAISYIELWLFS